MSPGARCGMCEENILGSMYKCRKCNFQTHGFCAELAKPSTRRLHLNHPHSLTLLPDPPARDEMRCEICRKVIGGFNLFCRICDYIIDVNCALKGKLSLMVLGQKLVGTVGERCMSGKHRMVQVIISSSYPISCTICDETLFGKALSCMTCEEMYHPRCLILPQELVVRHPLHSDHNLSIIRTGGFTCRICLSSIINCAYCCNTCLDLLFHLKCIQATSGVFGEIMTHSHNFYYFGINALHSPSTQSCSVCGRPCEDFFYGCIDDCNFSAHAHCLGLPKSVKNRRHQHTVVQKYTYQGQICSLCKRLCSETTIYTCNHCEAFFHLYCFMSKVKIF